MSRRAGPARGADPIDVAAAGGVIALPRSLLDQVHDRLIVLLSDAEVEPGTKLSIDALASAWNVSQTPIREALVRAEAAGLVVRQAMRGYRVAPLLPPEQFEQLMEMRMLIEPFCASRATERADASVLQVLEEQQQSMESAPMGHPPSEFSDYLRADIAFHDTIAAAAGNPFLRSALETTSTHAHRFRRFTGGGVNDATEAIQEHLAILRAIRAGDADAAGTTMRTHLQGVTRRSLSGAATA